MSTSVNKRLIKKDEVLKLVPYSIQHIYRKEKAGTFPKRVPVGENRVAWVEEEIHAWLESKMSARGGKCDA